jgi:hypothetical protein
VCLLAGPLADSGSAATPNGATHFVVQTSGGSVPSGAGRTVYGSLDFGGEPGSYVIREGPAVNGVRTGTFELLLERTEVTGTTRLAPGGDPQHGFMGAGSYTRTWKVTGASATCFDPAGTFTGDGKFGSRGQFDEVLDVSFTCSGHTPGHGGRSQTSRFRLKLAVTGSGNGGLIGQASTGLIRRGGRGGVAALRCGRTRCDLAYYERFGAGGLLASFPVATRNVANGGTVFTARKGSTQLSGLGAYGGAYATAAFKLSGRIDGNGRGTLTLSGATYNNG